MDVPRRKSRRLRTWILTALACVVLGFTSVALAGLRDRARGVERAGLYVDTVRRGAMLREVRGPGSLVPRRIRWVTALHSGRVEAIHVEAGAALSASTVLIEMSNSDIELATLQAATAVKEAEADFTSLEAKLESAELAQQALIADVEAQHRDAAQTAKNDEQLYAKQIIAKIILTRSRNRTKDLEKRVAIERSRLTHHVRSKAAQITAQQSRLEQLRAVQEFRRGQLAALTIRAGGAGVLQELPLEIGQWVQPGTLLAKVVKPTELKAQLDISELQAKDIRIGQKTEIDTRHGKVTGKVSRIDPAVQDGVVRVDVELDELPEGARPDLSVDGRIELERLENVVFVSRPVFGDEGDKVGLFKLQPDGIHAERVIVQLGKSSAKTIQVLAGLAPGDRVVVSDMSQWDNEKRIRLE